MKSVILEGKVDVSRVPYHAPVWCKHNCSMEHLVPKLCGVVKSETGMTSIGYFEELIELLNGREIRVTIETLDNK